MLVVVVVVALISRSAPRSSSRRRCCCCCCCCRRRLLRLAVDGDSTRLAAADPMRPLYIELVSERDDKLRDGGGGRGAPAAGCALVKRSDDDDDLDTVSPAAAAGFAAGSLVCRCIMRAPSVSLQPPHPSLCHSSPPLLLVAFVVLTLAPTVTTAVAAAWLVIEGVAERPFLSPCCS